MKLLPEPPAPVVMAFVGRLLADKGLHALIQAHALLARRGEAVRLLELGVVATDEIARFVAGREKHPALDPLLFGQVEEEFGLIGVECARPGDATGDVFAVSYTHLTLPTICSV